MAAVLFRDRSAELDAWLARRRALDQDRYDEVWEGVYVVNPAPHSRHGRLVATILRAFGDAADAAGLELAAGTNVGEPEDYRIPDVTVFDRRDEIDDGTYLRRASVVVEIRSPREDIEAKLPFYLAHGVAEVVLVDADARSLRWLVGGADGWTEAERSPALGLDIADIHVALGWSRPCG